MATGRMIPWICMLLAVMGAGPSGAGGVSSLHLEQARVSLPAITVFLHASTETGDPARNVRAAQFSATVGTQKADVKEVRLFGESGEGTAYIFLVDISKSLSEQRFQEIRQSLATWIDSLKSADRAAIITFGSEVKILQDYTGDRDLLKTKAASLKPTDAHTQLHRGIVQAMELGNRGDAQLPTRRVIITLSDGRDDFAGGMTKQEVLDRMKEDRVPVYAMGFTSHAGSAGGEEYLKVLGEFARTSGGEYFRGGDTPIAQLYGDVHRRINQAYIARLTCSGLIADGKVYRVQITLNDSTRTFTDGLDVRLAPVAAQDTTAAKADSLAGKDARIALLKRIPWWGYGICGIVLMALVVGTILRIRALKKRKAERLAEVERIAAERAAASPVEISMPYPPRKGVEVKLWVVSGTMQSPTYTAFVPDTAFIGRGSVCAIRITDDEEISGKHCELVYRNGMLFVRDIGSTNGTYINGTRIDGIYTLENDDFIRVGKTEFRVTFAEVTR